MAKNASLGIRIPNLVLEQDNEKGFEFRVQLEVPIFDKRVGARVGALLATGAVDDLAAAKTLVMANVARNATVGFKNIVDMAFKQNISSAGKKAKASATKAKTKPGKGL